MHRHNSFNKVGEVCPYRPTYDFHPFIDDYHRSLATCPTKGGLVQLGIEGWLWREDALKLYEMAHFCPGSILELGTYHGLSTSIMAHTGKRIVTVDISAESQAFARQDVKGDIDFILSDAAQAVRDLADKRQKFGFSFVDHSHAYQPVHDVCQVLPLVLSSGAFVLFHDWNDERNGNDPDYGVHQAVADGLEGFEFWGCFGCMGLFRWP